MSASIRNSVELQSLRGIAALCVVLHHSLRTLESTELTAFISEAMLNAHAAVVVFFVLSGFVLTKSLVHRGFSLSAVSDFYLRRMFRIYPAMWVGIIFGTIYLLFIRALPSPHFSLWAAGHYDPTGATTSSIIQTLLGLYNYLLPPLWTITVEIVASALLPLLVWLMSRRIGLAVSTIFALAVLSLVSGVAARQVPLYLVDFSFGIFLATNPRLTRFNPGPWGMVIAVTVLMWFRTIHPWLYHDALPSLVEGLASMVVIAGLVAGNAKWMRMRPLVLLGDWSFSMYLLHMPIAYTIARLVDGAGGIKTPGLGWSALVAVITIAITVPLAALIYHMVELPSIAAGKALISRVRNGRNRKLATEPS